MALDTLTGAPIPEPEDDTELYEAGPLGVLQRQLAVSRASQLAERKRSWDNVAQALEKSRPSKSEMWFSLASALAQPTKTGSFGEVIGNVSQTLGESRKAQREFDTSVAKNQFERDQDLAELGSKYDLKGYDLQEQALRAGVPKFLAVGDTGFLKILPGQAPEYTAVAGIPSKTGEWVETVDSQGNRIFKNTKTGEPKAADRSPEEEARRTSAINVATRDAKNISDAKSRVPLLSNSEKALERAIGLVDQSFTGPFAGIEKNISRVFSPNDPKLAATAKLDTIAGQQVVQVLKATFSGSTSNAELEYLDGLYGKILNSTASERKAALTEARDYVASRKLQDQQLLSSLSPQPASGSKSAGPRVAPTAPAAKNRAPITSFYKQGE